MNKPAPPIEQEPTPLQVEATNMFITYAHKSDPDGYRFAQYASDPIPDWAIDVRKEPPSFKSELEATGWMYDFVDDDFVDLERFAFVDDEFAMKRYNRTKLEGCCKSFDAEISINGRAAMIGCHYGHGKWH